MTDKAAILSSDSAEGHLAEIIAMTLIDKGILDRDALCTEIEQMASLRREEGATDEVTAGLVRLALSLRATTSRAIP